MMYLADDATEDELREMALTERMLTRRANIARHYNRSVVMNCSTFLPGGEEPDSQVQITTTPTGHAFITITRQGWPDAYVRIEPDEWRRFTD